MLETFCAAARVKAMLQEPGAPDVFNKAADILQRCCAPFAEEAFRTDTGILQTATEPIPGVSHIEANIIKTTISEVRDTLEKAGTQLPGNDHITEYKRLNIAGLQYCSRNYSQADSRVFFKNTSEKIVPGVIEHMFSVGGQQRVYYVAVRCYLPVAAGYQDPFLGYSDFGAQIWSCALNSQLDIVPVCKSKICHTISMPWGTELVLKAMNRVNSLPLLKSCTSTNLLPCRTLVYD
jgi:hypothetical protein